jgi:ankyrin repeat protein
MNVNTNNGWLLGEASSSQKDILVYELLKYNANIHINDDGPLISACYSCKKKYYKVIEILLKYGANVHARNDEPLKIALRNNDKKLHNLLLQYENN